MKKTIYPTFTAVLLLVGIFGMKGQDIHFSQFYNAPLSNSPALTGVFDGDYRFSGNYRNQWKAALSPFNTFFANFDGRYVPKKWKGSFLGWGLVFDYDFAGDSKLSSTFLGLSGSYVYKMGERSYLSLGVQAGGAQRSFKMGDLSFDNQYNGHMYDPKLSPNEYFDNTGRKFLDFAVGLNWHGKKKDSRTRMDVGVGAYHLLEPYQGFYDAPDAQTKKENSLKRRYSFYVIPTLMLSENVDMVVYGLAQLQGSYFESVGGIAGRLHLNKKRAREVAVQLGFLYRFNQKGDSFFPNAELHFRNWVLGLSYDVNISEFNTATNKRGGPEVTVRYIIKKVRPFKVLKICPII